MPPTPWTPGNYPPARRSDHIDVYQSAQRGEVHIPDPYRWLEEYSDETEKWISSQQVFTRSYLDKNTDKQKLEDAFRSSVDYAKVMDCSDLALSYRISRCFFFVFSSLRLLYSMTDIGIGSTTVGCRLKQVSIPGNITPIVS